jgi:hypothetical protein
MTTNPLISVLHAGHPRLAHERNLLLTVCEEVLAKGGAVSIISNYVGNELMTTYTIYFPK